MKNFIFLCSENRTLGGNGLKYFIGSMNLIFQDFQNGQIEINNSFSVYLAIFKFNKISEHFKRVVQNKTVEYMCPLSILTLPIFNKCWLFWILVYLIQNKTVYIFPFVVVEFLCRSC